MIDVPKADTILSNLIACAVGLGECRAGDTGTPPEIQDYSRIDWDGSGAAPHSPESGRPEEIFRAPHCAITATGREGADRLVRLFGALEIRSAAYRTESGQWRVAISHQYLQPHLPVPYNAVLTGLLFLSRDPARLQCYLKTAAALREGLERLKQHGILDHYLMRNTQREFALLVSTEPGVIDALQAGLPADFRSDGDRREGLVRLGVSAACMAEVTEAIRLTMASLLHCAPAQPCDPQRPTPA